tara:strand:- start:3507 stop:5489 length:1983 start_codon:yes stop_codon:yes gene_type:complete
MAEKVDTSTEALDASIDASLEQQLEMSAQFGSQAEAVMGQLHTQAIEAKEDYAEAQFMPDASVQADAFAELESDYDMLVGGIQREMMLNQQATLSSIQHQQNATQNYMDMISAALPALEARMSAQVQAAGRAGSGGGLGTSPYDFGPDTEPTDEPTDELVEPEAGDYDDEWAREYSLEEKAAIAKELGMDPHNLWSDPTSNFFTTIIEDPDRQKWFHEDLREQFGVNIESVEEAYDRIWGAQTEIDGQTGEWVKKPHWFHQDGLSEMHSLIANGMDPDKAYEVAYNRVIGQMEEQYADDEIRHDPEKYQGWVDDLEFIMQYTLQGTLHNRNEPFDLNYIGGAGTGIGDEFGWKDAGVTTVSTDFHDAFREAQEEDQQLSMVDFAEKYWEGKEEAKTLYDTVRADLGERKQAQIDREALLQETDMMASQYLDRPHFVTGRKRGEGTIGGSPQFQDVWGAIDQMNKLKANQATMDQEQRDLLSLAGMNLDQVQLENAVTDLQSAESNQRQDAMAFGSSIPPKPQGDPRVNQWWESEPESASTGTGVTAETGIDFSSPEMQEAINAAQATKKLGGFPQITAPSGQETLNNFIEQKKRETELLQFRGSQQPAPTPPPPTPPAPTPQATSVVPPHVQRMMDQDRRRKEAEAIKMAEAAKGFQFWF